MAYKKLKRRIVGGYKYVKCSECDNEIEIEKPIELKMPYCSECQKIVHAADQKYCAYCGVEFLD